MVHEKFIWAYDYEADILFIANPKRRSRESIEVQANFHVDVDKDLRLAAVEIWDASKFFRNVGLGNVNSKRLLKSVEDVAVEFKNWRNYFILSLVLYRGKERIQEKLTVPAYQEMSPLLQKIS